MLLAEQRPAAVPVRLRLGRLGAALLPVLALLVLPLTLAGTVLAAGPTLGYDFLAYHAAAQRVLTGGLLYDMTFTSAGGFGLFYYPPTFLPLILPFGLLSPPAAIALWTTILVVAFLVGVAAMPVSRTIRWTILLMGGLSFPFVYAVKLGQVGPLLFLTFALGWRWLVTPSRVGIAGALGAAIKMQPGLVLVWALLTRQWRTLIAGGLTLAFLSGIATLLAGPGAWFDFVTLVRRVGDPVMTSGNLSPGAIAYGLGVPASAAALIQTGVIVGTLGALVGAVRWATREASYLVALIASQLISPILWDHYALLLLLPVAYLLAKGARWALIIPAATSLPLLGVMPPALYPALYILALAATFAVGLRGRRAPAPGALDRIAA